MPYKYDELKEIANAPSVNNIECPIKGNNKIGVLNEEINNIKYPIKLRKGTFIYLDDKDNFIFDKDGIDNDLLTRIKTPGFKRETHRMGNLNSEDALTWNVFRSLDKENKINDLLSSIIGIKITNARLIYWSYDKETDDVYSNLKQARYILHEEENLSTEPDIIIVCDQCVATVEAKYLSSNNLEKTKEDTLIKYQNYYNYWNLFEKNMVEISTGAAKGKYELARNWLLGDIMRAEKPFYLLNLTLDSEEKDIETKINNIFKKDDNHIFKRITWEQIYDFCKKENCCINLIEYLENLAYYKSSDGINKLVKALNIK